MPFLTSLPLPRPELPGDSMPERQNLPWRNLLILGVLLIAALVFFLVRALTAERRAIQEMDPQARAALFQETWQGFQALCQPQADPALSGRCEQQARFLQEFPECDEACRQQLDSFTHPSR
jgi:hypothetical protein